ncbi:MAG: sigma 54-interacting transcriptional regulator, partial [Myxococcales bacterium]
YFAGDDRGNGREIEGEALAIEGNGREIGGSEGDVRGVAAPLDSGAPSALACAGVRLYGAFEGRPRAAIALEEGVQIVGSGPRVRLGQLLPDSIAPDELFQAEVTCGALAVSALSGETLRAPDGRPAHRAEIGPSQSFEIGGWRFALAVDPPPPSRVRFQDEGACPLPTLREKDEKPTYGDEPLALRVITPDGSHVRELKPPVLTFGRDPKNQLVLDYPTVSKFHGLLRFQQDGWWAEELRSANGLWVPGGQLVDGKLRVQPGSLIQLGRLAVVRLELRFLDELLNAPPPDDVRIPLVGKSPFMLSLRAQLARYAALRDHLLILGPTGSGKSAIAKAIAAILGRGFSTVDCGAIPRSLIESELFGSVKGAYTGAVDRAGPFELARGGVVFIDEICELPIDLQTRLLHLLQELEIKRVGGKGFVKVDARIVLATHRDPKEMIAKGSFREDLYYRMSRLVLQVPPLRERPEDVKPIAYQVIEKLPIERKPLLTQEAIEKLLTHDWPGNVRELENAVAQAAYRSPGERIEAEAIRFDEREWPAPVLAQEKLLDRLPERQRAFLKKHVRRAYEHFGHNAAQTARFLGYSESALRRLLSDFGLLEKRGRAARRKAG